MCEMVRSTQRSSRGQDRDLSGQMEQGNFSSVRGAGAGVIECRIDSCLGYRVYFSNDGDAQIIRADGTKKRQQQGI